MKKFILFLLLTPSLFFGQERVKKIKKGVTYITYMGNNIYRSSITGKSQFSGQNRLLQRSNTEKLKTKVEEKAEEFAKEKNAQLEIIGFEKTDQSTIPSPKVVLKFRLVYDSIKAYESNYQNKITTPNTKTDLNKYSQSIIKNQPTENIKDQAIKEIKQLKELLDSGILSKSEYDKKATSLKKIILGD